METIEYFGVLSLVPASVAIVLAFITRNTVFSLATACLVGVLVAGKGFMGFPDLLKNALGNTNFSWVLLLELFIGISIAFFQRTGAIHNFSQFVARRKMTRIRVQLISWFMGMFVYFSDYFSPLFVGSTMRALSDRFKISREKLAYIADSTSAPSKLLIPFNGWGAFIMGLLLTQGIENPFMGLISAMPYNFYPILVIIILFMFIVSGKDIGPMKSAELRTKNGNLFDKGSTPMVSGELTIIETKKGVKENSFNMFLPLVSMILIMPIMLFYTGYDESLQNKTFFKIIGNASGSSSVLYSVLIALIISSIYYFIKKIMTVREIIDNTIKGMSGMISLALLIILAFTIGNLCNELGTGTYVSESLNGVLSPKLIPVLLFLTSCFISFSTGTSWGTFAIMIAIAVPISNQMEVDSSIAIAAALGGGLFGDHCSPISDTSVISSMASASDHIDHVKTQIPYALISGIITSILYLIIGFIS